MLAIKLYYHLISFQIMSIDLSRSIRFHIKNQINMFILFYKIMYLDESYDCLLEYDKPNKTQKYKYVSKILQLKKA